MNTGYVHDHCAEQRRKKWQIDNRNTIIEPGDYVQRGFTEGGKTEHMWVIVKSVNNNKIIGELNNDPRYLSIKCGTVIIFKRSEIEQHIKK